MDPASADRVAAQGNLPASHVERDRHRPVCAAGQRDRQRACLPQRASEGSDTRADHRDRVGPAVDGRAIEDGGHTRVPRLHGHRHQSEPESRSSHRRFSQKRHDAQSSSL